MLRLSWLVPRTRLRARFASFKVFLALSFLLRLLLSFSLAPFLPQPQLGCLDLGGWRGVWVEPHTHKKTQLLVSAF